MKTIKLLFLIASFFKKNKLPDLDNIQSLGLLAVKITQHFALRTDFLSWEMCQHLSRLFGESSMASKSNLNLEKIVKQKKLTRYFSQVEIQAFNAASVGQVHFASLKASGRSKKEKEVVIKLIKGDFEREFLKDIARLELCFRLMMIFYPKLKKVFNPIGALEHIREYTLAEFNLFNEVKGAAELENIRNKYFKVFPVLKEVKFPNYYPEISDKHLLVIERIKGPTVDEQLKKGLFKYEQLLSLFQAHAFFIFKEGVFHGDLHPGNVILNNKKKFVFIDNAAISKTKFKISRYLFLFFANLCRENFKQAAIHLGEMAENKVTNPSVLQRYYNEFERLYQGFNDKKISETSLTRQMMLSVKMAVNHGYTFDKSMFPVIKSFMYMDGMVLRCKPDAYLMKDLNPLINRFEKIILASE